MKKKSTKTTIAGALAGLGVIFSLFSQLFGEGGPGLGGLMEPENTAMFIAGLGALGLGFFARDDDVSSEGSTASKDTPQ
jgi:hypothetical protein